MAEGQANRIEVDLRLLQDQNLAALRDFGDQFAASVDSLTMAMGGWVSQLEAAISQIGGSKSRGKSENASSADETGYPVSSYAEELSERIRRARRTPRFFGDEGDYESTSESASVAPPGGSGGPPTGGGGSGQGDRFDRVGGFLERQAFAGNNITEFEKAQFSLGNAGDMNGQGLLRYISHVAGSFGWQDTGETDPTTGRPVYAPRVGFPGSVGRFIGGTTGGIARGQTYAQSVLTGISRVVHTGQTNADLYAMYGYDRTGVFGIPAISSASFQSMKDRAKDLVSSWFGFNPKLTGAEARQIRAAVMGMGWSGDTADRYSKTLQHIRSDYGVTDFGQLAQMLDKQTRFGIRSVSEFEQSIKDVARAAQAAHMPLDKFIASLDSAADSLAASTGLPYAHAQDALTAFTQATGLDPSRANQMMSDPMMYFMAKGLNPSLPGPFTLKQGDHYGSAMMSTAYEFASRLVGIPFSQWGKFAKEHPEEWKRRMNDAEQARMLSPELQRYLGGMSLNELYEQSIMNAPGMQRGAENVMAGEHQLERFKRGMDTNRNFSLSFDQLLRGTGLSSAQRNDLLNKVRSKFDYNILDKGERQKAFEDAFGVSIREAQRRGFTSNERTFLEERNAKVLGVVGDFFKKSSTLSQQKKTQIEVTLSSDARQLLEFVHRDTPRANAARGWSTGPAIVESSPTSVGLTTNNEVANDLPNYESWKP